MVPSVTARVQEFYSQMPYPHVSVLRRIDHPDFLRHRLNYVLGRRGARQLPPDMKIWVPGAGTTLAVQLALNFPRATVFATDLSPSSLAITRDLGARLSLQNLETRVENLMEADYRNVFDYIDCAGVLNHVADPDRGWRVIARALKPSGVASIFVYNSEHRWLSEVWQKSVALLTAGTTNLAMRWHVAARLAADVRRSDRLPTLQDAITGLDPVSSREDFGDTLVHPHEVSYSLGDVFGLVRRSRLEFAGWRSPEQWDPAMYLSSPDLRRRAATLDPLLQYELVWTLAGRNSPYFDFYVQKPQRRSPQPAARLPRVVQHCTGVTYINVRRNKIHSQWSVPSIRKGAGGKHEVLLNEDSRHKSDSWLSLLPSEYQLLSRSDGLTPLRALLPAGSRRRAEAMRFVERMLSPGYGALAPC